MKGSEPSLDYEQEAQVNASKTCKNVKFLLCIYLRLLKLLLFNDLLECLIA